MKEREENTKKEIEKIKKLNEETLNKLKEDTQKVELMEIVEVLGLCFFLPFYLGLLNSFFCQVFLYLFLKSFSFHLLAQKFQSILQIIFLQFLYLYLCQLE